MQHVALEVETLRCEADEAEVRDDLLAKDGVMDAEVDLVNERVRVAFDEKRTTRGDVELSLRFFGLSIRGTRA